jgi:protein TonB
VQFTIAANGRFSGIRVVGGSGSKELDQAAKTTLTRLARFKPIPDAVGRGSWTVRVPIVYRLN